MDRRRHMNDDEDGIGGSSLPPPPRPKQPSIVQSLDSARFDLSKRESSYQPSLLTTSTATTVSRSPSNKRKNKQDKEAKRLALSAPLPHPNEMMARQEDWKNKKRMDETQRSKRTDDGLDQAPPPRSTMDYHPQDDDNTEYDYDPYEDEEQQSNPNDNDDKKKNKHVHNRDNPGVLLSSKKGASGGRRRRPSRQTTSGVSAVSGSSQPPMLQPPDDTPTAFPGAYHHNGSQSPLHDGHDEELDNLYEGDDITTTSHDRLQLQLRLQQQLDPELPVAAELVPEDDDKDDKRQQLNLPLADIVRDNFINKYYIALFVLLLIIGVVVPTVILTRRRSDGEVFITLEPSFAPTEMPTGLPSFSPTDAPSRSSSDQPTLVPTPSPSGYPTGPPSSLPTGMPTTATPSSTPSSAPTSIPTTPMPTVPFWQSVGANLGGTRAGARYGNSVAMSANGQIVAIGGQGNAQAFIFSTFTREWLPWGQVLEGEASIDMFGVGCALSANGLTLAVLASRGYVRVFEFLFASAGWSPLGQTMNDGMGGNKDSLALSDNGRIVAVGSITNSTVTVYAFTNDTWVPMGQQLVGDMVGSDSFGGAVAMSGSGTVLAVGASTADNMGQARVYEYSNNVWLPVGQVINGTRPGEELGWAVDLSHDGTTLAVATIRYDSLHIGRVRVYTRGTTLWEPLGSDIVGENPLDESGTSVVLSEDGRTVAIGAGGNIGRPGDTTVGVNAGHVRVYNYTTTNDWIQLGADIDGTETGEQSGYDLAISNDGLVLAVGAPLHNYNGQRDAGVVRVLEWPY